MNILFHVGVGNTDRPERWGPVCTFFSDLARSFEVLQNNRSLVFCHSKAARQTIYKTHVISDNVYRLSNFHPDIIFTWNGSSKGDQEIIKLYKNTKIVFAELGFFDHYNTCYFDLSGTGPNSMNIVEELDSFNLIEDDFKSLISKYKKDRLFEDKYIFVPFQDESDTQIVQYSPIKKMSNLIEYILNLYRFDDSIKVLYKPHPKSPIIVPRSKKLIKVSEDVHHYIPYAEKVIGINSTVLFETLMYHNRVLSLGMGLSSRNFKNDFERKKFIMHCYAKQINLSQLSDPYVIKNSWIYNKLITSYENKKFK